MFSLTEEENQRLVGGRKKKSSRRSSILKISKSPSRKVLEDIDNNSDAERTTNLRRVSRRVSFAQTCTIKEFEVQPKASQPEWLGVEPIEPTPESASGADPANSQVSLTGLQSLMTGQIDKDALLSSTAPELPKDDGLSYASVADGFDPAIVESSANIPVDETIPRLSIEPKLLEIHTPCAGSVDRANEKWHTGTAKEGGGATKIDSSAFLKQIMSGSSTGDISGLLHKPKPPAKQLSTQEMDTRIKTCVNKYLTQSTYTPSAPQQEKTQKISMEKTVVYDTKGGEDMEFTEAIKSEVIAEIPRVPATNYANVTWANESTKVYSKSMLEGHMELTTCEGLSHGENSGTDGQTNRHFGEKTRIFGACDGDDDGMEFTTALTGNFQFCSSQSFGETDSISSSKVDTNNFLQSLGTGKIGSLENKNVKSATVDTKSFLENLGGKDKSTTGAYGVHNYEKTTNSALADKVDTKSFLTSIRTESDAENTTGIHSQRKSKEEEIIYLDKSSKSSTNLDESNQFDESILSSAPLEKVDSRAFLANINSGSSQSQSEKVDSNSFLANINHNKSHTHSKKIDTSAFIAGMQSDKSQEQLDKIHTQSFLSSINAKGPLSKAAGKSVIDFERTRLFSANDDDNNMSFTMCIGEQSFAANGPKSAPVCGVGDKTVIFGLNKTTNQGDMDITCVQPVPSEASMHQHETSDESDTRNSASSKIDTQSFLSNLSNRQIKTGVGQPDEIDTQSFLVSMSTKQTDVSSDKVDTGSFLANISRDQLNTQSDRINTQSFLANMRKDEPTSQSDKIDSQSFLKTISSGQSNRESNKIDSQSFLNQIKSDRTRGNEPTRTRDSSANEKASNRTRDLSQGNGIDAFSADKVEIYDKTTIDNQGMDLTTCVGGFPAHQQPLVETKNVTVVGNKTIMDDGSMEMTTCLTSNLKMTQDERPTATSNKTILFGLNQTNIQSGDMEFTTCIGGSINGKDNSLVERSGTTPEVSRGNKTVYFDGNKTGHSASMEMTCVSDKTGDHLMVPGDDNKTVSKLTDKTVIFDGNQTSVGGEMEFTTCVTVNISDAQSKNRTLHFGADKTGGSMDFTCVEETTGSTSDKSICKTDKTIHFSDEAIGRRMDFTCVAETEVSAEKVRDKTIHFPADKTEANMDLTCVSHESDSTTSEGRNKTIHFSEQHSGADMDFTCISEPVAAGKTKSNIDKTILFSHGHSAAGMDFTCMPEDPESERTQVTSTLNMNKKKKARKSVGFNLEENTFHGGDLSLLRAQQALLEQEQQAQLHRELVERTNIPESETSTKTDSSEVLPDRYYTSSIPATSTNVTLETVMEPRTSIGETLNQEEILKSDKANLSVVSTMSSVTTSESALPIHTMPYTSDSGSSLETENVKDRTPSQSSVHCNVSRDQTHNDSDGSLFSSEEDEKSDKVVDNRELKETDKWIESRRTNEESEAIVANDVVSKATKNIEDEPEVDDGLEVTVNTTRLFALKQRLYRSMVVTDKDGGTASSEQLNKSAADAASLTGAIVFPKLSAAPTLAPCNQDTTNEVAVLNEPKESADLEKPAVKARMRQLSGGSQGESMANILDEEPPDFLLNNSSQLEPREDARDASIFYHNKSVGFEGTTMETYIPENKHVNSDLESIQFEEHGSDVSIKRDDACNGVEISRIQTETTLLGGDNEVFDDSALTRKRSMEPEDMGDESVSKKSKHNSTSSIEDIDLKTCEKSRVNSTTLALDDDSMIDTNKSRLTASTLADTDLIGSNRSRLTSQLLAEADMNERERSRHNSTGLSRSFHNSTALSNRSALGSSSLVPRLTAGDLSYRSHAELVNVSQLNLQTMDDYLALFNVHFMEKQPRRSTLVPVSMKEPETVSEILGQMVHEPHVSTYEWACQQMTERIAKYKVKIAETENELLQNLPSIFGNPPGDAETSMKMGKIKSNCRRRAELEFKQWRYKMFSGIETTLKEEEEMMIEGVDELSETLANIDDSISKLRQENMELDKREQELADLLEKKPLVSEVKEKQKHAEAVEQRCKGLERECIDQSNINFKLEENLKTMAIRQDELEAELGQQEEDRSVELMEHLHILKNTGLVDVKRWRQSDIRLTFLQDTMEMRVTLGQPLDDNWFSSQQHHAFANISLRSLLKGTSSASVLLAHRMILMRFPDDRLCRQCTDTRQLPQLIHELSSAMRDARQLVWDIEQDGVGDFHQTRVNLETNRVLVAFSSMKCRSFFELKLTIDPEHFPHTQIQWDVTVMFGPIRREEIQAKMETVRPGHAYLKRIVNCLCELVRSKIAELSRTALV